MSRRLLAAVSFAVLACAAPASLVPAAAHANTYTQILCFNPDTRLGVGMPPEFLHGGNHNSVNTALAFSDCTVGTQVSKDNGLRLRRANNGVMAPLDHGYLNYVAPSGVAVVSGRVHRTFVNPEPDANFVWNLNGVGTDRNLWAKPATELIDWFNGGDHSRGVLGDVLALENRLTLALGNETTWGLVVVCNVTTAPNCPHSGMAYTIHAGKLTLRDDTVPRVTDVAGSLATDATLAGSEKLTFSATDTGSGVYRARIQLRDVDVDARVVDSHSGRCADVNPANSDPYEFARAVPCRLDTSGSLTYDTEAWPEGEHNLKLLVEDASGNARTVLNKTVVIDNVAPPRVVTAPAISGNPRRGNHLVVTPAEFDGDGAPITVEHVWQRCTANGSECKDIAGASGMAYALTDADLNRAIRVVETATTSEGHVSAASGLTRTVTREDGTLPPDNDGVDNDGDGQVDEAGENAPPAVKAPSGDDARRIEAPSRAAINGEGASLKATVTGAWVQGGATRTLAYGKSLVVQGRLVDDAGRPIRNAVIEVFETKAINGAPMTPAGTVATGSDGGFRVTASSKAGSRSLTFVYRYERGGAVTSNVTVGLVVKAGVRLSVKLKGIVASYSGRVLAGSMPRGGKLVIVQGRAKGGSWQTFASRRATKTGTFKGKYRLKVRRPGKKLQFRVIVVAESGWNFGQVTSKAVTRTVR